MLNWQYEYFENMTGLKKSSLCKGDSNTLFDAYSQEEFEYDMAGNPYRYKVGSSNWNIVTSTKNNQTSQITYASDAGEFGTIFINNSVGLYIKTASNNFLERLIIKIF